MVIVSNCSDTENPNERSTPPPNLLILEKLKQARMQRALLQNGQTKAKDKKAIEQISSKKFIPAVDITSSSSSSSINKEELIKRTTVQEKIFSMHCRNFNEKKNEKQTPRSNLNSVDSLSNIKKSRTNNIKEDDDDQEYPSTAGSVLHFRQPIINQHNESIYYESRGRMEPMDWSVVHNKKNSCDKISSSNELNKNPELFDKIKKLQENKPEPSPEFINFVSNSSTSKTVYEGRNNLEQIRNTIDSPLLKVQRILNNNPKDDLLIDQEIKQAFEPSKPENHIINAIDSTTNNLISIQNGKSESHATSKNHIQIQATNITRKEPSNSIIKLIPNICEFDSKDSSLVLLNKKTSESNKLIKKQIDEYSDDMFTFENVRPKQNSNSSITSANSSTISDESIPLSNPISESVDCKSNSRYNKLKKYLLNDRFSSFDSDDASSSKSSKEIISIEEPMSLKMKMPRKESKNASTQYSTQLNESISTSDDSEDAVSEKNSFLIKKCSTRYFKKSNNSLQGESSTFEKGEKEIGSEEEPLLREVSTRYFTKPSILESKLIDDESNENNKPYNSKQIHSSSSNLKELNLTPENETKGKQEIDNTQSTDSSFTSTDSIKQTISMNNDVEKCMTDLNQQNILCTQNVEDIENNDTAYCTTIHEHKSTEENSIHIEEIDINTENINNSKSLVKANLIEEILPSDSIKETNLSHYDQVNSDEEFDIVNIEQFTPFTMLVNKLQQIKDLQKAIATEISSEDSKSCDGKEKYKHNSSSSTISKSNEDSLASENNYSGVNASASSNMDTDNDILNSSDSSNVFSAQKNCKNTNINEINTNDNAVANYDKSESTTIIIQDSKAEMSSRRKKMKNALTNFQKEHRPEDIKGGCHQVEQLDNSEQEEAKRTEIVTKRHKILQKLKRRNHT